MKSMQLGHSATKQGAIACRTLCWMLVWTAVMLMAVPAMAAPPDTKAPRVATKAGNITALLPVADIVRGTGKNAVTNAAKRGDEIYWNDLVKTEKGGRARITLADQSILSLGSQAQLRVVKHDAKAQQTALELAYGRLRAEVATVTRDGGNFSLKTPTAVAGVIGTVFGADGSLGSTQFLCISGVVQVGSSDPTLPGTTTCEPGMAVTVGQGKAPEKRPATTQEIQQFIQDTEPAAIQAISPASALSGTALEATISGTHLDGLSSVDAGNGVTASLQGQSTSTSANLHIVVQPSAQPGPRVLTLHKQNGQTAAVVFNVLAPPTATQGTVDLATLKKPFYDVLEQERQSELAALNGMGLTVKQSADGAANQLYQANQTALAPISLTQAGNDLQAPVTDINTYLQTTVQKLNDALTQAQQSLDSKLQTAITNLQNRTNGLVPDDAFKAEVASDFAAVNQAMLAAFQAAHNDAGAHAQTDNTQIATALQNWLNQITASTPRWDNKDQTAEVGAVVNFEAGRIANNAQSIQWAVCDPSYKPAKIGQAVPAQNSGCQAIPGFGSSTSEFTVATCTLNPADYVVRILLNGQVGYETYLHVTRPGYDDPSTRMTNLASAYSTLKPDQFMAFFDSSNFPGYTALSENIRATMLELSSMNVLVRLNGAPNVACNDATLSGQWQSNYTFKGATTLTTQPPENITVRMHRTVGQGWFITDFQGDNGTVQGTPPGPQTQQQALPDPAVVDLGVFNNITYTTGSSLSISGGATTFGATITNSGDADLTQSVSLAWTVTTGSTTLATFASSLTTPLSPGQSTQVQYPVTLPSLAAGTPVTVSLVINASSPITEKNTSNDNGSATFSVGTIDLKVLSVTPPTLYAGLPTANTGTATIQNLGTGNYAGSTGNLVFSSTDMNFSVAGNIPAIAAGGQGAATMPTFTPNTTGAHTLKATISPSIPGDLNTANDTLTVNVTVLQAYDLKVNSITMSSSLIGGQAGTATIVLANNGTLAFPGQSNALTLTSTTAPALSIPVAIPAISAGGTATVTIPITVPMNSGTYSFTSTIAPGIAGDTTTVATHTATTTAAIALPYNLSVNSVTMSALDGGQAGSATVVIGNTGPLNFAGQAGALTLTSTTSPALSISVALPAVNSGSTATVNIPFTVPLQAGSFTFTATLASGITGNAATGAQTLGTTASIVLPYNLSVNSVVMSALDGGQAGSATVVIGNSGPVNFAGQANALTLTSNTTPALSFTVALPAVNAGSTATVNFPFTVPMQPGSFTFTASIVGPIAGNAATGAQTLGATAAIVLPYDLNVGSVTMSALDGGQGGTASVVINNTGPVNFPGQPTALTLTSNTTPALSIVVALPTITAGGSATVTIPFTVPMQAGSFTFTATIAGGISGNAASGAQFQTATASIVLPYDLKVQSVTMSSNLIGGQPGTATVILANTGPVAYPGLVGGLTFSSNTSPALSATLDIPAITAGGTATVTIPIATIPMNGGTFNFTATIASGIVGNAATGAQTLTASSLITLPYNLSVNTITMSPSLIGGQGGTATVVIGNSGPLNFAGQASSLTLTAPTTPPVSVTVALPAVTSGSTATVNIPFTVPMQGGSFTWTATIVGPITGNAASGAQNLATPASIALPYDLKVSSVTMSSNLIGGQPGTATVVVANTGPLAYPGLVGGLTFTSNTSPALSLTADIPSMTAGGSATITIPIGALPMNGGTFNFTATIASGIVGNAATGAQTLAASALLTLPYNLSVNNVTMSVLAAGQTGTATVVIGNSGPLNFAGQANSLTLTSTTTPALSITVALPAVSSGSTATVNIPFTVPSNTGTFNFVATISGGITGNAATGAQTLSASGSIVMPYDLSVSTITMSALDGGQSGTATVVINNAGPVTFPGQPSGVTLTSTTTPGLSIVVALPTVSAGSTATINIPFTVPMQAGSFSFTATLAGGISGNAATGAQFKTAVASIVLPYDLKVQSVTMSSNLIGGQPATATIILANTGPIAYPGLVGGLTFTSNTSPVLSFTADIPAITAGGTATVTIPIATLPMNGGTFNFTATIASGIVGNAASGAQTLAASALMTLPYNLSVNSVVMSTLDGGQSGTATVVIGNSGPLNFAGQASSLMLTAPTTPPFTLTVALPAVNAGSTATVNIPFTVPMQAGSFNWTATIAGGITGNAATGAQSAFASAAIALPYNLSVNSVVMSALDGGQAGTATVVIGNSGPVNFAGQASALTLTAPTTPPVSVTVALPAVAAGSTATVNIPFTVPMQAGPFNWTATIAGGITGNAATGAQSAFASATIVLPYNLVINAVTPTAALIGGQPGTMNVFVGNTGPVNFAGQANALTLTSNTTPPLSITVALPAITSSGSATVSIPFTVPMNSGSFTFTATLAAVTGNAATGAQTLGASLALSLPYNLAVNTVSLSSNLIGGQTGTGTVVIGNTGPLNFAGLTNALTFTSNTTPPLSFTVNLPAVNAGSTATVNFPFTVPLNGGSFNFTGTIVGPITGNAATGAQTLTSAATITLPYDLVINAVTPTAALIGGQPGTMNVFVGNTGPVNFAGQASALTLTSNTTPPLSITVALPLINSSGSATVSIPFTVPMNSGSFTFTATLAAVSGNAATGAQTLGASLALTLPYNLGITSVTVPGSVVSGQPGSGSVVVFNNGPLAFPGLAGGLTLTSSSFGGFLVTENIPSIAASGSATIPFAFTTPTTTGGTFPLTGTIQAGITGDTTTPAHTLNSTFSILAATVDLQLTALGNGASDTPPFLSTQNHTVQFTVTNGGTVASSASDTYACTMSNGTPVAIGSGTLSAIPAGNSALISFVYTVPKNLAGTDTVSCTLSTDPLETVTANNTSSYTVQVNSNVNLLFASTPVTPSTEQMGHSSSLSVTVQNNGQDNAAAGWNVLVQMNATNVGSVTGPALAAGASTPLTIPYTVPVVGPAPQNISTTTFTQINQNAAISETSTADNTSSAPLVIVDFTATDTASTLTGVAGRAFSVPALMSTNPGTYPLTFTYAATGVPAGLTLNSATGQLSGSPSAAGPSTLVTSVSALGVSHSAGSVALTVVPEIAISPVGTLPTIVPGQPFTIQLNVTGGVGTVSLVPALPTGITPVSTLPTSPTSGTITWNLQAALNAPAGNVNIPIQVTDSGVPATNTPAANFTYTLTPTVNGQADYVVTSVAFTNLAAPPYTGSNALQSGSAHDLTVVVANNGNTSPTGTITVQAYCSPGCSGTPPTGSGPAPAAGNSTTITVVLGNNNMPTGTQAGTATITSYPAGSIITNGTFSFDVVDYMATPNVSFPTMNLPINGTAQLPFTFAVAGTTPLPSIPLTASVATSGVTFSGITNPVANGTAVTTGITIPNSVTPGTLDSVTIYGTNEGSNKTIISQLVKFYNISMAPQTGINNASNPYILPVLTSVPSTPSQIMLQLAGTFDTTQGGANISVVSAPTGVTANLINASNIAPGGLFELDLYALLGASGAGTVTLQATVPETNPAQTYTYTFYVFAQTQVDLSVVSITPQTTFTSSNPWLYGQQASFDVVVQNVGTQASNGSDKLQFVINGRPITAAAQTIPVINANSSTTVTVTLNLPDYPWGTTASVNAQIYPSLPDPNTGNNQLASPLSIAVSDWKLNVLGAGNTEANPMNININSPSGSVNVGAYLLSPATSWSTAINLMNGATSTGFSLFISGGTAITSNSQSSLVLVSAPAVSTISPGGYFVQVIGQVGNVQRQGTIHINVSNSNTADPITLSGTGPNSQSGILAQSPATPTTAVQVNGPLPEQVVLTPNCSGTCSSTPKVDMTFTESTSLLVIDPNTAGATSPTQLPSINGASMGTNYPVGLQPILNPDGTVNASANIVAVSLNNQTYTKTAPYRTPSPDPVGGSIYNVLVNVGDIVVSPSVACSAIAPSQAAYIDLQVVAVNNFNANLTVSFFDGAGGSLSNTGMLVSGPGTYTYSGGFATQTYHFINSNSTGGGLTSILMGLSFSSVSFPAQSTTKYFPLVFDLSTAGGLCPVVPGTKAVGVRTSATSSGAAGGGVIRGFYGKHNAGLNAGTMRLGKPASGSLPDVQVTAADVTFSPSVPKPGDNVEVRFKLKNASTVAAKAVPVALQVNGQTVTSDTFDVTGSGSALGALHWDSSKGIGTAIFQAPTTSRMAPRRAPGERVVNTAPVLTIVIDPQHTIAEGSTVNKMATVAHFSMASAAAVQAASGGLSGSQRVVMELGEGVCAGFKFVSGPMMNCAGDFSITVQDLGNGQYVLESTEGVADLGAGNTDTSRARFGSQALAVAGHTYAVELASGQIGLLTVNSISNKAQLTVQSQRIFRKVAAANVVKSMGGSTGITEPGEVSGGMGKVQPTVFLDLGYQMQ